MSNYDNHIVGIFQDDIETVKEFLKIAINTIFFHRWINNNNYICETSLIKDISYMKIEDNDLQKDIDNLLNNITTYYSKSYQKFQIDLDFYTKNQGFLLGLFQKKESCWEKWNILIKIVEEGSKDKGTKLRNFLSMILKQLNTDKDFMPEINLDNFEDMDVNNKKENKNNFNFPYEIKLNKEFEQESFIKLFKKRAFDTAE